MLQNENEPPESETVFYAATFPAERVQPVDRLLFFSAPVLVSSQRARPLAQRGG